MGNQHMQMENTERQMEPLLNDVQVANLLSVSLATVRHWRVIGAGPKFLKIGASVRYRPEDLRAFIQSLASPAARKDAA